MLHLQGIIREALPESAEALPKEAPVSYSSPGKYSVNPHIPFPWVIQSPIYPTPPLAHAPRVVFQQSTSAPSHVSKKTGNHVDTLV